MLVNAVRYKTELHCSVFYHVGKPFCGEKGRKLKCRDKQR